MQIVSGTNDDSINKEWESILSGKGRDNLADVLARGWDELAKRDTQEVATFGEVAFDEDLECFHLKFFNVPYVVDIKNRTIYQYKQDSSGSVGSGPTDIPTVSTFLATLIVHYLASVKNIDVEGEPLSFREIPGGGSIYFPAFQRNAIRPIIERFGERPQELIKAGERLGGTPIRRGDAAVEIPVFPKIPVTVIVWAGDEEIPANANILFDKTAKEQIHIEDLAVIGGVVAGKLVRN
jgi:hypothetical protein